jgi:hypothetical protein
MNGLAAILAVPNSNGGAYALSVNTMALFPERCEAMLLNSAP